VGIRAASCWLGLCILTACGAPSGAHRQDRPRDLLTDLADDGSLAAALSDDDAHVRQLAALALGRLAAGQSAATMLAASDTEADAQVLAAMCFAFGQWGSHEAWPFLTEMGEHRDASVRAAALTALGRLHDDAFTPCVVRGLGDENSAVRQAAALALGRLDGRRYDHPRHATEEQLKERDAALAQAALRDSDVEVRWRATYALASLPNRPGLSTVLGHCSRDQDSPLSRLFALRGLGVLQDEGLPGALPEARRRLADSDGRVVVEAARILARHGEITEALELTADDSAVVRLVAIEGLRRRALAGVDTGAGTAPGDATTLAWRSLVCAALQDVADSDPSPMVVRESLACLAVVGDHDADASGPATAIDPGPAVADGAAPEGTAAMQLAGRSALERLARSTDPRDRERAARLLADDELRDDALLQQLLDDPEPQVAAAALGAWRSSPPEMLLREQRRLIEALQQPDPALRGSAAEVLAPFVASGRAPAPLVSALADALDDSADYEMEEARLELAKALGLPQLDPMPPTDKPEGPLLERVLAEQAAAGADPAPEVLLETTRGDIRLALDRITAPRHVESFLELCSSGYYDGLDVHRLVPNFVVQGLDPRHDGWGVGGRRVPDEFSPLPCVTGVVGMPHAGSPHTGGCQIFITQVPTPHLEGDFTIFGRVMRGMDVVQQLEIGDVITRARRVPSMGG